MSCSTQIARVWPEPIAPGGERLFEVDFAEAISLHWESKDWQEGDTIRLLNGYDAQCVQAGRSGPVPPRWPDALTTTPVRDGSARWQVVAPSTASRVTSITGFEWDPPEGITDSGGQDGDTRTVRELAVASNVAPGQYEVVVTATCANGEVIVQPCVLQVG